LRALALPLWHSAVWQGYTGAGLSESIQREARATERQAARPSAAPDYSFTQSLADGQRASALLMTDYIQTFVQKIKTLHKAVGDEVECDIRFEFQGCDPHVHLTVMTAGSGW
jgi:hypothetical protein